MKRFFKAIRCFWRGQTQRMRAVYIMVAVLLALSLAFGIYMLIKPDEPQSGAALDTLFDPLSRDEIQEIVLHHAGGKEYAAKRYTYELELEDGSKTELSGFRLVFGERLYSLADEPFSELVVGTGTHYIYDTVISAPDPADPDYTELYARYEKKLAEYGFSDKSPYYEVKAVDGTTHRVYYGSKSLTGGTYYVRLEGKDAVYVTTGATVGDLLYAEEPTTLVNASFITPLTNEYAYAYPKRFSLTEFTRYGKTFAEGEDTVTLSHRVGYKALNEDGEPVRMITLYPLGSSLTDQAYRDAFLGRTLGECNFSFKVNEGKESEATITVVSIDYIDRADTLFDITFINKSFRDLFHRYSIYEFSTKKLKNYLPDTDAVLDALEKTSSLTGSVVALDFSPAMIEKYKLYAHMIELDLPVFGKEIYRKDEKGNDTEDLNPLYYTTDMLYVSEVTENGTRYVGSVLYGMVAEVDASALAYLEGDLYDWIEPALLGTSYEDIVGMRFDWNYSNENKWLSTAYDFGIYYKDVINDKGNTVTVIDRIIAENGDGTREITETIYRQLYYRMLYTRYAGGHGLSDEELASVLADESRVALAMTMTLSDGSHHTYSFIPISADRVLVSLNSEDDGENSSFVIYGSTFKAFARGYVNVMENIPFEHTDRYG